MSRRCAIEVACPKCGRHPGEMCYRKRTHFHAERELALRDDINRRITEALDAGRCPEHEDGQHRFEADEEYAQKSGGPAPIVCDCGTFGPDQPEDRDPQVIINDIRDLIWPPSFELTEDGDQALRQRSEVLAAIMDRIAFMRPAVRQ